LILPPLSPATVSPVSAYCSITLTTGADGTAGPTLCPNGGVNAAAWNFYASELGRYIALGPSASEQQVISTMCTYYSTLPITEDSAHLVAAYYGWPFASDPAFTHWPYYPSSNPSECPKW
jgi:hypothetical protein